MDTSFLVLVTVAIVYLEQNEETEKCFTKYVLVSGFVFETLLVLFIGYVVGKWLDKLLNSSPLMIVLLLFTMSLYAVYHLIKIAGKLEE